MEHRDKVRPEVEKVAWAMCGNGRTYIPVGKKAGIRRLCFLVSRHAGQSSHLFFPNLVENLAVDAQRGGRSSLESLYADFNAASLAVTEFAVLQVVD